ncbi:GSCOCG00005388001-RA-CDS [Cotesia congregata]|nr:GSCOCG00005388001-RA-CDS [Cotesia congregata]
MCINNECKCKRGFLAQSNDQCSTILLKLSCEIDANCKLIEFSKCSLNKTCVCSENIIATSPIFCSLLIGEFCNNNRECGIRNSECVNYRCQCKPQYLPYLNNSECQLSYLGMSCENSTYCEKRIKNTICINNICECNANYYSREDNSCRTLAILDCENNLECSKLINSLCIDKFCQCKPDDVLMKGKCLPRYLGGPCEKTSDCSNIKFAVCLKNQCICNGGFSSFNQTLCARDLGTICLGDEDCLLKNSHCYQHYCECRDGYIQDSTKKCLPMELRGFCFDDADCKLIKNARCSSENKCICKINYVEINEVSCVALLDGSCSHDNECAVAESVCVENKCQCDSENFQRFDEQLFLYKSCSLDTDCIDIPHAKCWNTSMCACESNFIQLKSSVCAPLLGGYCTQHNDCIAKHSVCIKNKCQCDFAYTEKLSSKCEPILLGQPCESDINCNLIRKGICSQNKICVCDSNTFAIDKITCLPILNTYCTFDECQI